MAEYIDREKLLEIYKNWIPQLYSKEDEGDRRGVETCIAVLEDAQAVDAVPVVRCRDCIHAVEIEKDYIRKLFIAGTKQCELGRGDQCFGYPIVSNDGFCDSGERKSYATD